MLTQGKLYTRNEIHDLLGGGPQGYLPHKNGRVVAGCLGSKMNPEAPDVVLVGSGPQTVHWAKVFCEQDYPVPVFVKQQPNEWKHVGEYKVEDWTEDPADLQEYGEKAGRTGITRVLFLTRG